MYSDNGSPPPNLLRSSYLLKDPNLYYFFLSLKNKLAAHTCTYACIHTQPKLNKKTQKTVKRKAQETHADAETHTQRHRNHQNTRLKAILYKQNTYTI